MEGTDRLDLDAHLIHMDVDIQVNLVTATAIVNPIQFQEHQLHAILDVV